MAPWIGWFDALGIDDVPVVGGKNASLGEMRRALTPLGIRTPDGFATTADAYREFLCAADLQRVIDSLPLNPDSRLKTMAPIVGLEDTLAAAKAAVTHTELAIHEG